MLLGRFLISIECFDVIINAICYRDERQTLT